MPGIHDVRRQCYCGHPASTIARSTMRLQTANGSAASSGWSVAAQTGAALAGAMGVRGVVFTQLLPLTEAQARCTSAKASTLATSNYLGYLVGAILGIT